jgi:hypothetical protein
LLHAVNLAVADDVIQPSIAVLIHAELTKYDAVKI